MSRLTPGDRRQLASLEQRVEVALEVAAAGPTPAPEALRELLLDAISRLRALEVGSEDVPDAVESVERAIAALEAWQRWRPATQPSA